MQYEAKTPPEYIKGLEDDWRKDKLIKIRNIIHSKAPELNEYIEYKMLGFGDGKKTVFNLNAQKNYVSLYVGDIGKIDESGSILKNVNLGKGCIRFSKSVEINESGIEDFIDKTIEFWKAGKDIYC